MPGEAPVETFVTALVAAAAVFIGCLVFYVPIGVMIGRGRDAIQLAAALAVIAFLVGLAFGPIWRHSDADDYPERTCSGRQC